MVQRLRNSAAVNWNAYRAWHRACLRSAWRETRVHFSSGWRSAGEFVAPGIAATLALYVWGNADSAVSLARGAAVSLLWIVVVFCWNFSLAPYRMWRAALSRMAKLAVARRIDLRRVAWDGPARERRPRLAGWTGFRDSARDTVKPAELDVSGAAALSHYVHRFSAANGHAIAAFGMTPAYMRAERRGL